MWICGDDSRGHFVRTQFLGYILNFYKVMQGINRKEKTDQGKKEPTYLLWSKERQNKREINKSVDVDIKFTSEEKTIIHLFQRSRKH